MESKMVDIARVQKELQECNRDKDVSGISVKPKAKNLTHLIGSIPGPLATPNDGGTFNIDIVLFYTWHPNISSQSGAICLDILKDQRSPALTIKTALLSIQALLSASEPDDPQDAVVAQQYLRDYQTFASTARYWTEAFAKSSSLGVEEKVLKFVEMGFPEALVRSTPWKLLLVMKIWLLRSFVLARICTRHHFKLLKEVSLSPQGMKIY